MEDEVLKSVCRYVALHYSPCSGSGRLMMFPPCLTSKQMTLLLFFLPLSGSQPNLFCENDHLTNTLCLESGYNVFDLPLRNQANLVKIGEV